MCPVGLPVVDRNLWDGLGMAHLLEGVGQRTVHAEIHEVVATTAPGTLVELSSGSEDVHAGLNTLDFLATQDAPVISRLLRRSGGLTGDDSAA